MNSNNSCRLLYVNCTEKLNNFEKPTTFSKTSTNFFYFLEETLCVNNEVGGLE